MNSQVWARIKWVTFEHRRPQSAGKLNMEELHAWGVYLVQNKTSGYFWERITLGPICSSPLKINIKVILL